MAKLETALNKGAFIRASVWLGISVAAIGLAVLAGWALGLESLTVLIPGHVSMKANTAVSFICIGTALSTLTVYGGKGTSAPVIFARALALVAVSLGALNALEYAAGIDFGIDQMLFTDPQVTAQSPYPGRMSPVTALNFVLFGVALYYHSDDRKLAVVNALTAVAGAFSLLGVISALYGAIPLVPLARYTNIAVHTSIAFVLMFLGIIFSRPGYGIMKVVSDEGAAGLLARRLLPAVIALEISTGWFRLYLRDRDLVTREYGAALTTLVNLCFVVGFFVLAARALKRSEDELREHRERLEELVDERTAELTVTNEHLMAEARERRLAEKDLIKSEERFRLMVKAVKDYAIVMLDPDGNIASWNEGAERIKGYTSSEAIGRHFSCFYPAGDRDAGKPARELELVALAGRYEDEGYRVRKDGSAFWANVVITALKDDDGGLRGFLKVTRDITERKKAEDAVRRINEELELRVAERTSQLTSANKELEAFCYSVSHDLRSPLRSIDGFSQAVLEDYEDKLDDQGRDCLHRVRAASQRMGQLIDDLLKLSRVTRGEMQRESVDLSAVARKAAEGLSETQAGRQVELIVQDGLSVDGDPQLLRVVMDNLIGNAWKFTSKHASARIEVGGTVKDGRQAYFVRDDGSGFDMAYSDKLFGPFQRLHAVTDFPGTGIGLATVQRIIARHGGKVWAEGAVEKGATFYFTIGQDVPAILKEAA
ncbi:MAG: PAS domain S-box protein [Nitrospirae bacterium]|nr:PAS domain S-box protein [Nitrospirota bacterium]